MKKNALIFFEDPKLVDKSPFLVAIDHNKLWAIEIFCDYGADLKMKTSNGMSPMMYAATVGVDDIAMYLTLRTYH